MRVSTKSTRAQSSTESVPVTMVWMSTTWSTSGASAMRSNASCTSSGAAVRPISRERLVRPSTKATNASRTPISSEASPSQSPEPVSWCRPTPSAASASPSSAAESS